MMRQTLLGNAIYLVCTYRPINDYGSCYEGLEYRRFFYFLGVYLCDKNVVLILVIIFVKQIHSW